jgi:predicted RNase H-like nuclease
VRHLGVDGCRGGWLVAEGPPVRFRLAARFEDLLAGLDFGQAIVAVDMPIGLAEAGPRQCDRQARTLLGRPRASSVFAPPCRSALAGLDYADVCRLNRAASGVALSLECFNLLDKLRQVDAALTPARQRWVREVHPEVVFALLSAGRGLAASKKTLAGQAARLTLLGTLAIGLDLTAERARLGRSQVAIDDLLDAMACLTAALRLSSGQAMVLPSNAVQLDARGLRMEIVG